MKVDRAAVSGIIIENDLEGSEPLKRAAAKAQREERVEEVEQ
jgi:hypothetical protein